MTLLIVGLIVFLGIHAIRMVAPAWRGRMVARLGIGPYKGLFAVVSLIGFALIVWGFGRASADSGILFVPPLVLRHVSYAVMIFALVLAVASAMPAGLIKRFVRHPLLIATVLWALAHLFVNGDVAAVILFGAFLVWALADLAAVRRRPTAVDRPPRIAYDIAAVVIGLCLYGLLVWRLHGLLFGVSPMA